MAIRIREQLEEILLQVENQVNSLNFGTIEFIIINGEVDRIEIKQSIKNQKVG